MAYTPAVVMEMESMEFDGKMMPGPFQTTVRRKDADSYVEAGWEPVGITVLIRNQTEAIEAVEDGWDVVATTGNVMEPALRISAATPASEVRRAVKKYRDRLRFYGPLIWHAAALPVEEDDVR